MILGKYVIVINFFVCSLIDQDSMELMVIIVHFMHKIITGLVVIKHDLVPVNFSHPSDKHSESQEGPGTVEKDDASICSENT